MSPLARVRALLTPAALTQLLLGWGAFAVLSLAPIDAAALATPALFALLAAIVAVIVVCAFGVVTQAEHLARRLGDPYGTLVLTLSIVVIEVVLISAVMLGPGDHVTIARDSVMAVSMIILNLAIGAAILVGALRHRMLRPNHAGIRTYLLMLVILLATAFAVPALTGGSYPPAAAVVVALATIVLYAFFLYRQTGPRSRDFTEVSDAARPASAASAPPIAQVLTRHRTEVIARVVLLVLTVIPIILLSHDMAALLDDGLARLGAPVALSGALIAMIVFLPETITTIRAAALGEIQRVSNLCHGALVSTVGLTIPAVLVIGLLTGQVVILGESPVNLLLLAATMLLTAVGFLGRAVRAWHGALHLALFAAYGVTMFL